MSIDNRRNILLNMVKKVATLAPREAWEVSIHPYTADTQKEPPADKKNYIVEALCNGKPLGLPEYVLFQCDDEQKEMCGFNFVYRTPNTTYFDEETLQKHRVHIKNQRVTQNEKPVTGKFIYGVNRKGEIYIAPRIIKFERLSDEERTEKNLEDYPVMSRHTHSSFFSGKAGMCFGELDLKDGKITSIDNKTGHYRCTVEHLANFLNRTNIAEAFNEHTLIKNCQRKQPAVTLGREIADLCQYVAQKWPIEPQISEK